MDSIVIASVTGGEIAMLETALRQLSADLGDEYTANQDGLAAAVCGPDASCLALLATRDGTLMGAVLAAPVFSTVRGGAGLFVTDLWVAAPVRGQGLARKLLAAAVREGARRGAAHFLKLTVYHDNSGARAAYDKLGFRAQTAETNMVLVGDALETLKAAR